MEASIVRFDGGKRNPQESRRLSVVVVQQEASQDLRFPLGEAETGGDCRPGDWTKKADLTAGFMGIAHCLSPSIDRSALVYQGGFAAARVGWPAASLTENKQIGVAGHLVFETGVLRGSIGTAGTADLRSSGRQRVVRADTGDNARVYSVCTAQSA